MSTATPDPIPSDHAASNSSRLGARLTAYADGTLHHDGCKEIEALLEKRPELRERLGDIVAIQHLLRDTLPLAPIRLDDIRRSRILKAAAHRPRLRRPWLLAVAASLLLAVSVSELGIRGGAVQEMARVPQNRIADPLSDVPEMAIATTEQPAPSDAPRPMLQAPANYRARSRLVMSAAEAQDKSVNADSDRSESQSLQRHRPSVVTGGLSPGPDLGIPDAGPTPSIPTRIAPVTKSSSQVLTQSLEGSVKAVDDSQSQGYSFNNSNAAIQGRNPAEIQITGNVGGLQPSGAFLSISNGKGTGKSGEGGKHGSSLPRGGNGYDLGEIAAKKAQQVTGAGETFKSLDESQAFNGSDINQNPKTYQLEGQHGFPSQVPPQDESGSPPDTVNASHASSGLVAKNKDQEEDDGSQGMEVLRDDRGKSADSRIRAGGRAIPPPPKEILDDGHRKAGQGQAVWAPLEPGQLMVELATRGERQRTVGNLDEVLCRQWNQQNATANQLPMRILGDIGHPMAYTASLANTVGGNLLAAASRIGAQLVPIPGGIEIQTTGHPLDPTVSYGLSREAFRAAFGSTPMQAIGEDAQQTFAIDDSTASFDAAQADIKAGRLPDPATIEPQQFYNAMPTEYPPAQGEEAFALYAEAGPSPFANGPQAARTALVSIGVVSRQADAQERIPLDLIILMDVSGSMGRPGGLDRAQRGLATLLPQLDGRDRVAVVAFSDVARIVLPPIAGDQHTSIAEALAQMHADGATNAADGLALAYQVAGEMVAPGRACRVLLATDGAALAGDSANVAEAAVGHWHGRGVSLLIVGVGNDASNTKSLDRLAQRGDGQYIVAASDQQVDQAFVTKLMPARLAVLARDAKVQMTWNRARVSYARLIGFENRRLANEQYRDNRVAAGNLNQDAQATALFEIILDDKGSGPLGTAGVRYFDTRLNRVVELERALPGSLVGSNVSPRLDLLACAAELGEIMQAGWWRNVRGDTHERLEQELAHIDSPLASVLNQLAQRHHDLEIKDATP